MHQNKEIKTFLRKTKYLQGKWTTLWLVGYFFGAKDWVVYNQKIYHF